MADKFAVNQRVRDLMTALGFANNVDGFYKHYFGEGRSERLRTVVKDAHPIKTDFLVEIADKIAQLEGKKINGHWLLTGLGEMFLEESSSARALADKQVIIDTQRELIGTYRSQIAALERQRDSLQARLDESQTTSTNNSK